jgi:hypothetical protein
MVDPKGEQMKLRIHKPDRPGAEAVLVEICAMLDRTIPVARTVFMVTGVIAAALRTGELADYLFLTGLLFHFAIWFENWWLSARIR